MSFDSEKNAAYYFKMPLLPFVKQMYRSFIITDMKGRPYVKGEKTSSLFMDSLKCRSYRVEIQGSGFELDVGPAVMNGMQVLE